MTDDAEIKNVTTSTNRRLLNLTGNKQRSWTNWSLSRDLYLSERAEVSRIMEERRAELEPLKISELQKMGQELGVLEELIDAALELETKKETRDMLIGHILKVRFAS